MSYEGAFSWRLTLTVTLTLIILTGILIFVIKGIYNRYFHPLKDIPGPFWSSITDLAKLSALSSSDITAFSLELHQRYGMISRRMWTPSSPSCFNN